MISPMKFELPNITIPLILWTFDLENLYSRAYLGGALGAGPPGVTKGAPKKKKKERERKRGREKKRKRREKKEKGKKEGTRTKKGKKKE